MDITVDRTVVRKTGKKVPELICERMTTKKEDLLDERKFEIEYPLEFNSVLVRYSSIIPDIGYK